MESPSDRAPYDARTAQTHLRRARRIAVLMAPRLGDSLLMMNMAYNLKTHGREVTVFGDYIYALRGWFPGMDVRPSLPESHAATLLARAGDAGYDCAVQMHDAWPYALHPHTSAYFYYDCHVVITGRGFVKLEQIRDFCQNDIGLTGASLENGLRVPAGLVSRKHDKRVVIHPTSTSEQRCWARRHFVELALRLQREGYEPHFVLAPGERAGWECLAEHGLALLRASRLADVAAFIHESGWFIGNESGIGHLASNVGVPTLTVTGRPTRTRAWRPAWTRSRIVYPLYIVGGRWRDLYWREWLLPGHVLHEFKRLTRDCARDAGRPAPARMPQAPVSRTKPS
ncbi:glycosyltransferase family 9 protein [Bordetella sp. N]|uniref:glycosyltransferase family 9 protein n=1 Tax=Bordetella sp. N TaxID=1746199 RepID=UPI0007099434|nr:glycosyltransferase family 9 protein [Bordetella sp. N]ALM84781.1 hypothetical protein ASB57_19005 [Bordetella sp. N]